MTGNISDYLHHLFTNINKFWVFQSEEKQLFYEPCMDNTPVPPTSRDYSLLSPHYSKLKNRSRYKIDQKYFKSASNSSNTLVSHYFITIGY